MLFATQFVKRLQGKFMPYISIAMVSKFYGFRLGHPSAYITLCEEMWKILFFLYVTLLPCFHRSPQRRMAPGNDSITTQFILVGLTDQSVLQLPLFFLFLVMYTVTVMGNLSLIILIGLSSHLHTPMYFFLFNLSFIDLCYYSVFAPKMLINIISKKIISYMGCMAQLYFFTFWYF